MATRDYGFGQDFATPLKPVPGGNPIQVPNSRPYGSVPYGSRDMWGNPVRGATGGWEGADFGETMGAPLWNGVGMYNPTNPVSGPYGSATNPIAELPGVGQYQAPQMPAVGTTPAPVTPATPAAFAGSGLNTLYGIDSESNLTEDQKKLARMIQGKFDASLNRRDRELAQYGAPRLASFVEDEALARAMSLARGLNIPVKDALGMVQGSGPASRGSTGGGGGGSGSTGRAPSSAVTTPRATTQSAIKNPVQVATKTTPPGASPSQAAKWRQLLTDIGTFAPMFLGKDGIQKLMEGGFGLFKDMYKSVFGADAPVPPDAHLMQVFGSDSGGPIVGAPVLNPLTGQLMGFQQPDGSVGPNPIEGFNTTPETLTFGGGDITGPFGEGADYGFPVGADPYYSAVDPYAGMTDADLGLYTPPPDIPWWEGGDYGFDFGYDDFGGGEYWMPENLFSDADPFGIGGW